MLVELSAYFDFNMTSRLARKASQSSGSRVRRGKAYYLPLPRDAVETLSLSHHLALAASRSGRGDCEMLHALTRVLYLTYFLQQAGFGTLRLELYKDAEDAVAKNIRRGKAEGVWNLEENDALLLEKILTLHDEQLSSVALRFLIEAESQFVHLIDISRRSPIGA